MYVCKSEDTQAIKQHRAGYGWNYPSEGRPRTLTSDFSCTFDVSTVALYIMAVAATFFSCL